MKLLLFVVVILAEVAIARPYGWFGSSLLRFSGSLVLPLGDCKDGVCNLPTPSSQSTTTIDLEKDSASTTTASDILGTSMLNQQVINSTDLPPDFEEKVSELVKLGWPSKDAATALQSPSINFDVSEAAALLQNEEEASEVFRENTQQVKKAGWNEEAASSALRTCNGNITAAIELLENEEAAIQVQFEGAVQDMLQNGWDEVVARRALLSQWSVDQRKAMGQNSTMTPEQIAAIRPTLKYVEPEQTGSNAGAAPGKQQSKPTPASQESCVFEVTSANFQKLVLESPVPVLVDVYADWCGPCKQLGPILENAAMQSGGMFRLAKVNSDNERAIAEALQVQGLPSVFSMNQGKFTDRFVGMLPQEQLQQFLVRSVTGYGARVQAAEVTDEDLNEATKRVGSVAGLASISFKAREKLRGLVDEALSLEGSTGSDGGMSAGVKTTIMYISNAAKDIRDAKFRSINCSVAVFREKIAPCPAAIKLLEVAGFHASPNTTSGDDNMLSLVHSNTAVLNIVSHRATEFLQKLKFSAIRQSPELGSSKSLKKKVNKSETQKANEAEEAAAAARSKSQSESPKSDAQRAKAPVVSAASLSKSKGAKSNRAGGVKQETHTVFSSTAAKDTIEYYGGGDTVMEMPEEEEELEEEVEIEEDEEGAAAESDGGDDGEDVEGGENTDSTEDDGEDVEGDENTDSTEDAEEE